MINVVERNLNSSNVFKDITFIFVAFIYSGIQLYCKLQDLPILLVKIFMFGSFHIKGGFNESQG